ncbi:histidine phosphatase family protein [uncultured Algibacter sp.]|uniref:SixA phosphatase family protein n=1 Tax=uncultured Algibacter sp. TaxID=298659 RepID=UPI00262C93BE|nr:histidine phosphatase family protein [uncultured Algibacter sp.]
MKKLILVRHAKSSWSHDVIDHQRPLKKRGLNDSDIVSRSLKTLNYKVEKLISSDAIRTKTTAEIFISNLDIDRNLVHFNHNLYDFSGENLIKVIKSIDDALNCVMVFGHNHAITAFVNTYGSKNIYNVPTCGVVIIEFNTDKWSSLEPGKTLKTLFPKDLKA